MTTLSTRIRIAAALLLIGVSASACGGDGDSSPGDTVPNADDGAADLDPADDGGTADPPAGDPGAVVTKRDLEYSFSEEDTCLGTATAMTARFTDGPDIRLDVDLPPADWATSDGGWDPPEVDLTDRSGEGRRSYLATPALADQYPGTDAERAVVDDYRLGDGRASGSGFVIDTNALVNAEADGTAPPAPVPFTFSIVCVP